MTTKKLIPENGRIPCPWESKEEVPTRIWTGSREYSPGLTDEQWLEKLNRDHYEYWQKQDALRSEERKKKSYPAREEGDQVPCASPLCKSTVPWVLDEDGYPPEGSRLCETCKDYLRENGTDATGYVAYQEGT